jgi:hypothetical protein
MRLYADKGPETGPPPDALTPHLAQRLYAEYGRDASDVFEDFFEVVFLFKLHGKKSGKMIVGGFFEAAFDEVALVFAYRAFDFGEEGLGAPGFDFKASDKEGRGVFPFYGDFPFFKIGDVFEAAAVFPVYDDAPPSGDIAYDGVAGNGVAAFGKTDHHVFFVFDSDLQYVGVEGMLLNQVLYGRGFFFDRAVFLGGAAFGDYVLFDDY